jgi:hypothetical protein
LNTNTVQVMYEVGVEVDRGHRPGGLARCHLIFPGSELAICGYERNQLYIADWTWPQVSMLYRCHSCGVAAPEA